MRLRSGELTALVGALTLVGIGFAPWFDERGGHHVDGWSAFGVLYALMLIAAVAGVTLAVTTATERSPGLPVFTAVWTTLLGLIAVLAAIGRLVHHPASGATPAVGAWIALAASAAIFAGAWQTLRDERTDRYEPAAPEARPAPPAG
ncbi:MAG TPA: hypothetical protein VHX88_13845 [Solirubrobacteraceae bacterium]|nr:hypothetical protein [Solirubrobacteraceae bacterium]